MTAPELPTPADPPANPAIQRRICIGLTLTTLVVFADVRDCEFLSYDDHDYVSLNPHIHQGLTWDSVVWAFTSVHSTNWHPLTTLSHMLDWKLFGPAAGAHHLVNLLLHTINTVLLFGFFTRVTGAIWRSAFVAAMFALHPLHVESVAWISERKDVLSGLFFMLTLRSYAGYVSQPGARRYAMVMLWSVLGLLSKPMLVTLPFVLFLLDWWPLNRLGVVPIHRLIREKLPLLALTAGSCVATLIAQHHGAAVVALEVIPVGLRLSNAALSYWAYLGKMVWPVDLCVYYPFRGFVPWWQTVTAIILLLGLTVALLRMARLRPHAIMGWLWYVGMLVPVSGIVLVGQAAMADRYTYLPLIGIWIALTWSVPSWLARSRNGRVALGAAAAILVAFCATVAWLQVGHWRDSVALWDRASRATKFNFFASYMLGNALTDRERLEEAVVAYRESVRVMPNHAESHYKLAVALDDLGRTDEAKLCYREAIRIHPSHGEAHNNLGLLLAADVSWGEAEKHYREAIRLLPQTAGPHNNLGLALAAQGRWNEAIAEYEAALRLKPDYEKARRNLAAAIAAKSGTNGTNGVKQP
jgi:cytochrome c-type biogenesis protein CcmH/NrfG